jgi:hypothetical protein
LLLITYKFVFILDIYKQNFLAIFTGFNKRETDGWMFFGRVHSFLFVSPSPLGADVADVADVAGSSHFDLKIRSGQVCDRLRNSRTSFCQANTMIMILDHLEKNNPRSLLMCLI